jgi:hypothetical protein
MNYSLSLKKNMSSIMECEGYYTLKPGIQNLHIRIVLFTFFAMSARPAGSGFRAATGGPGRVGT